MSSAGAGCSSRADSCSRCCRSRIWRCRRSLALIALRFIHGAATAIFGPVASASLSDIAPAARRGTWLSTYSTVQGAGQAFGPIIAGYLIAAGGFDLAFVAAGLIGLATPADRQPAGAASSTTTVSSARHGRIPARRLEIVRER